MGVRNRTGTAAAVRIAAFASFIFTLVMVGLTGYAVHLNADTAVAAPSGWWLGGLALIVYSAVGLVVVRSPTTNIVGVLMIAFGVGASAQGAAEEYALYSSASGSLALHEPIAHLGAFLEVYPFAVIGLMALFFPTGRLPSRRWWFAVYSIVAGMTALALTSLLSAPTSTRLPEGEVLAPALFTGPDLSNPLFGFVFLLLWVPLLLGVVRLLIRFFRSQGVERLQLKWLTYVLILGFSLLALAQAMSPPVAPLARAVGSLVLLAGAPVAIGFAILRFRLYDVDRIISRTVGYALVVGLLGVVYASLAVWLPSRLTDGSALYVAGATLAAAALFNPLRRRVLIWVDGRFYRARYDAARVAEDFSGRLRGYVDVAMLTSDWVAVVTSTMHPSSIGVWVKGR